MNNAELNTALYKKVFAEQEKYRNWLLSQPPAEIITHAFEYTSREDLLLSLEVNDLTDQQASALLKFPNLLAAAFSKFERRETNYMDIAFACIETCANEQLRLQFKDQYKKSKTSMMEKIKSTPKQTIKAASAKKERPVEI